MQQAPSRLADQGTNCYGRGTRPGPRGTEWGSFRTPAGEAVYFTLAFQPDLPIQEKTDQRRGNVVSTTLGSPHERPGSGCYWIKSSLSYANGNCVEVASLPSGEIGVRNSRDSVGPVLVFTSDEWHAFLGGVRNGEFDSFGS